MALLPKELFGAQVTLAQQPRLAARSLLPARFGADAGAALLPIGTPVALRTSDSKWVPYQQPNDAASYTLTNAGGDLDGGSFVLNIDGLAITCAWNATAAQIQAEVNATLLDAGKPYTIAAVATAEANIGVNAAVVTITFSENAGAPSVDLDGSGLLDAAVPEPTGIVLAAVDAGTQLDGTNLIRGFVYESTVQLDDTDDVLGIVMVRGEAYEADVNTAAIRAVLGGSPSDGELQAALRDERLNSRILIRGLNGVS
jgi:hypothetical protein